MNKFKTESYVSVKYGTGKICSFVEKLKEKMNKQDYIMELWYFPKGYGLSYFLVGVSIEKDDVKVISKEINRMINNGYLPDIIDGVLDEIEENENFPIEDLTGMRFGDLTVIGKVETEDEDLADDVGNSFSDN